MKIVPPGAWPFLMTACAAVVIFVAFQQWGWVRVALGSVFLVGELACLGMYVLRAGRPTR